MEVYVSYAAGSTPGALYGADGTTPVPDFTDFEVSNMTDISAATNESGDKVTLSFGAPLDTAVTINKAWFSASVNDPVTGVTTAAIDSVSYNSNAAKLDIVFKEVFTSSDAVKVSYSPGSLTYDGGAALPTITSMAAVNHVLDASTTGYWQIYDHYGNWGEVNYPSPDTALSGQNHIVIINNAERITFYGYGSPGYKDFLLMNNTDNNTKVFEYTLDTAGVSYHSMEGGGFLFNTDVTDDLLSGYSILFVSGAVKLYKLEGIDITAFNNEESAYMSGYTGITLLNTYPLNTLSGSTLHQIRVEASSERIEMWDNYEKTIDRALTTDYGHGIGLIASYAQHGCSQLSYFTFSNLEIRGINIIWPPITNLKATLDSAPGTAYLTFKAPTGATSVTVEQSMDGSTFEAITSSAITDTTTRASISGLDLSYTRYYYRLNVVGGSYEGYSNIASVRTPAAPVSNLAAAAGNATVTLTFPRLIGATAAVVEISTDNSVWTPAAITGSIDSSSTIATVTGLTNGTLYYFRIVVTGGGFAGTSNVASATPVALSSGGGGHTPTNTGTPVVVNGESQSAGTQTESVKDGVATVTVQVDEKTVSKTIDSAISNQDAGGSGDNVIEIPVSTSEGKNVNVNLTGDLVQKMEQNDFTLKVTANNISYLIPTKEIQIADVAKELKAETTLDKIELRVEITQPDTATMAKITEMAQAKDYEIVIPPMTFEVTAVNTVTKAESSVSKFSNYVQRMFEIPAGVDPTKITTGIVYNDDGTFSHIPTEVVQIDGKYYAKLNSLTNSTYSVIWNPITVASVENHWSKTAVNDMASRLVIKNPDTFNPSGTITRGEFAEYITKALGVYRTGVAEDGMFTDVAKTDTLADAIKAAVDYGIIKGYTDGSFKPSATISRQEAMVMYSRAMDVVGLTGTDTARINNYTDYSAVANWAKEDVKEVISAKVFNGVSASSLAPKATFTNAEAATAVRNLLVESGLIND